MSLPQDDPRLTAFLLGELDDGEARRLREELAANQEISEELKALQGVSHALREELLQEISPGLKDEQLFALQSRIDLIEGHEQGNGAAPGAGPKWYMRLELWMPLSAAMGFLVALIIFASTTPWLVEGIRPPQRGSEPISIGEIPEPVELSQWEKDQEEWKASFWPKLQGASPEDFLDEFDRNDRSYSYIEGSAWNSVRTHGQIRVPVSSDHRALDQIMERLEAGLIPVEGMLRFEQALAGLKLMEYEQTTLLIHPSPWDSKVAMAMIVHPLDGDKSQEYFWLKISSIMNEIRYRLWGYNDRLVQSGQNDLGLWQADQAYRIALLWEQRSTAGDFPASIMDLRIGKTFEEARELNSIHTENLIAPLENKSALIKAILMKSFLEELKPGLNAYALADEQIDDYFKALPEDDDKALLRKLRALVQQVTQHSN